MKIIHKIFIGILYTTMLSATAFSKNTHQHHSNHHNHNTHQHSSSTTPSALMMHAMHHAMMETGFIQNNSVEYDYLANMIPHHQGAIDSAKMVLKYGKNAHIKALARKIIVAQQREIIYFNRLLKKKRYNTTPISVKEYKKFIKDEKSYMDKMMQDMEKTPISGNIDKDFIAGMIPHHQGAIDVSRQILEYSKDIRIQNIAINIIKAQQQEIYDFKYYLQAR